ncbi:putative transcription regulator protein [Pseudooceanicola batsensis HTCC2597]|uniref:Putative transcription regulator protein n=1 Tax=Pseudooceanicola batsensis (strain ATCC BAA-863 / DSM 15984 / KCTC 12145 / HTCC2597) TaxID=252305 RepID=A3TYK7_PSEBH|nr:putative transcription regulator protein [Pseudooceanicola batsensis HTCC2597]
MIFVGSPIFFSDSILRFVHGELGGVRALRVPGVRALKELTSVDGVPQVCVLEERMVDEPDFELDAVSLACGGGMIALAYYHPEIARRLLARPREAGPGQIGFVPLGAQMDVWLAALRMQLCGERFVPSELLDSLQPENEGGQTRLPPDALGGVRPRLDDAAGLTGRELQVLELVSAGKQNKSIANDLGLSEHTVKLHIHHVLAKLNVRNRTGATTWFLQNRERLPAPGWIDV